MRPRVSRSGGLAVAAVTLIAVLVFPSAGGRRAAGELVEVVVESRAGADAAAVAAAAGGRLQASYGRLATALVPRAALASLEADPDVLDVRRPLRPVQDAVGEGAGATNAPAWHAAGHRGQGVRVAVIDSAFRGSDFFVEKQRCANPDTSSHGTAVGQIVVEMAPAAQVVGYCVDNEVELGDAVRVAARDGARVIVQSLSWFNGGRGDGTGAPESAEGIAAAARSQNVVWVNSAGNFAHRHWAGTFTDADWDGWSEFGPGDEGNSLAVPAKAEVCAYLKWDDWPRTGQNFNFFLYGQYRPDVRVDQLERGAPVPTQTPIVHSTNQQVGSEPPTEQLCYANTLEHERHVFLAIQRVAASAAPRFDIFITAYELQYQQPGGSVAEPATSPSVLAVGAACWQGGGAQPYSSRGPTLDGRIKPDLVGPDSVSSLPEFGHYTGCGSSGFRGSSAAAPHAAGAAALVLGRHPTWTPDQVRGYLEQHARDLDAPGKDNDSGAGMLTLPGFEPPPPPAAPSPPPPPPPPQLRMVMFETLPRRSRAGAAFRARAVVALGDTGTLLSRGRIACTAALGRARLRARSARFRNDFAECGWALPRSAAGKLLRGSLGVSYQGATVRKAFRQRVARARRGDTRRR